MGVLTCGGPDLAGRRGGRFNPLHRGMGVLTCSSTVLAFDPGQVSILYIEAWGY